MKLSELLSPELILLPMEAADKWEAITAMARVPVRAGVYPESMVATVENALVVRERSMTTGMEHGIAIPHAAVDGLPDVVGILGISRTGIPFETLDGQPARIIVCLVIPRTKKLLHIKTLAEIARLLSRRDVREQIQACETPADVMTLLSEQEQVR